MQEESIASYANNIITFSMMIIVSAVVFLVLFIIWRGMVQRAKKRYSPGPEIKDESGFQGKGLLSDFNRTPYLVRGIFILASGFIFIVLLLFLVFTVFNYIGNSRTGQDLFIIAGIVFYLILILIFLVRSKILD